MTLPSWLASFIKTILMVGVTAIVAYLADPAHLTFLSGTLGVFVAGVFAAIEAQMKTNAAGQTALFGTVKVR